MTNKFVSHAQCFEDWILFCALEDVQDGFYIDVGANDPSFYSVTKAFYDMGWNGINIEPLKCEYKKLCLERPRDINLNIGVGSESASLELFIAGAYSTCDPETARLLLDFDEVEKEIIPVKRLSDVLDEHLKDNERIIHFCKIDVEGFERNVLEGMDFKKYRPLIFVMEAVIPGTLTPCHDKWEDILLDNRYGMCFASGFNRYYVDTLLRSEYIGRIRSGFDAVWKNTVKYDIETDGVTISLHKLGSKLRDLPSNTVFYGAGRNMSWIIELFDTLDIRFCHEIWDINAEDIVKLKGHKVSLPDFDKVSTPLMITVGDKNIATAVSNKLSAVGFDVIIKDDTFLEELVASMSLKMMLTK